MTDRRTLAVAAVILTFMAVTVGHVAHYAGGFESGGWRWLGWPYALAVDAAIVICAWLTRWATTRHWAWAGYFAFVVASGAMNAAAIRPWTLPLPDAAFAWVYSLFPTGAIGLLGFLARQAEAVGERAGQRKQRRQERRQSQDQAQERVTSEMPAAKSEPAPLPFCCEFPGCGLTFASQNALNAHQRAHSNGHGHERILSEEARGRAH